VYTRRHTDVETYVKSVADGYGTMSSFDRANKTRARYRSRALSVARVIGLTATSGLSGTFALVTGSRGGGGGTVSPTTATSAHERRSSRRRWNGALRYRYVISVRRLVSRTIAFPVRRAKTRPGQMMLDILHRHVVGDMDGFPRISTCKYV